MTAVETAAARRLTKSVVKLAANVDADGVALGDVEMLEIVLVFVEMDARIRADRSPNGTATTRIALAMVTKLRR
jgi:hypothetical protein